MHLIISLVPDGFGLKEVESGQILRLNITQLLQLEKRSSVFVICQKHLILNKHNLRQITFSCLKCKYAECPSG